MYLKGEIFNLAVVQHEKMRYAILLNFKPAK